VRAFVYPLLILCAVTPKMLVVINFLNEKLLCAVLDDRWTIEWSRALHQTGNLLCRQPVKLHQRLLKNDVSALG
jgi:hypothetical protein